MNKFQVYLIRQTSGYEEISLFNLNVLNIGTITNNLEIGVQGNIFIYLFNHRMIEKCEESVDGVFWRLEADNRGLRVLDNLGI